VSGKKIRTQNELNREAELVLKNLELWKLPVCPFEIAEKEGIELLPGSFSEGFDGRIRFVPEISTFAISYRKPGQGRTFGRVRFTIAHELAHYFLHRDYLLSEQCHSSKSNFISTNSMESEADQFASSLLMPEELFRSKIKSLGSGIAELKDLVNLANNVFITSITSTVLRYCTSDLEACGLVLSKNNQVCWARFSEDMKYHRMGFYGNNSLPKGSITSTKSRSGDIVSATISPETWFDSPDYDGYLWEEALDLGQTGLTLTFLSLQD